MFKCFLFGLCVMSVRLSCWENLWLGVEEPKQLFQNRRHITVPNLHFSYHCIKFISSQNNFSTQKFSHNNKTFFRNKTHRSRTSAA